MAILTIGGKDFPAALNLRSARLFEEKTGQSLYEIFQSLGELGGKDDEKNDKEKGVDPPVKPPEPAVTEGFKLPVSTITAAVWALANAKRGGPDFDFVEESIGLDEIQGLVKQATDLIPKGLRGDSDSPLAIVAENPSQPIG